MLRPCPEVKSIIVGVSACNFGIFIDADRTRVRGNDTYNNSGIGILVFGGKENVVRHSNSYQNRLGIVFSGPDDASIASGGVIMQNRARGNETDLVEAPDAQPPSSECRNVWKQNDFDTQFGPAGCID